jgi:hypothetical protein
VQESQDHHRDRALAWLGEQKGMQGGAAHVE